MGDGGGMAAWLMTVPSPKLPLIPQQVRRDMQSDASDCLIQKIASYWCSFADVGGGDTTSAVAGGSSPPPRGAGGERSTSNQGGGGAGGGKPRWLALYESKCSWEEAEAARKQRLWNDFSKHARSENDRWLL